MATIVKWKVFARLSRDIGKPDDVGTPAFNVKPSPGIFSQFSIPLNYAYVPMTLTPTATFYQVMKSFMDDSHLQKFPVMIHISGIGECAVTLQIRLYVPNLLVFTLNVSNASGITSDAGYGLLSGLRSPLQVPQLRKILDLASGVINSGNHREPKSVTSLQSVPAFQLQPVSAGSDLAAHIEGHEQQIVGLLLGVGEWRDIDRSLVKEVLARNKELNRKSRSEALYINKQGIIYLIPQVGHVPANVGRFSRTFDLFEIGGAFQHFLDDFPFNRHDREDFADYVFLLTQAWVRQPSAILAESYTNDIVWAEISRNMQLSAKLALKEGSNRDLVSRLAQKQEYFGRIARNWWESPDFASSLDSAAFSSSSILNRIVDADLRSSILSDLREAETSLGGKNYKAAVVMAGAAVEAMLLALLEQETAVPEVQLRKKGLNELVDLVKSNGLTADIAMLELIDNSLRQWRNFVHPGKALRTGVRIDEDHARIAVTGASALAKSLK